jgi:hypothetical protein
MHDVKNNEIHHMVNDFFIFPRAFLGIALIDEAAVIERILRHLGLWEVGVRVDAARDPPELDEPVLEPWLDDPFPDYDHESVFVHT